MNTMCSTCHKPKAIDADCLSCSLNESIARNEATLRKSHDEQRFVVESDTGSKRDQGGLLQAEGYGALAKVLERAFDQSARGKGKERHSRGEEFTQQVIIEGARRFGTGAMLFQAFKKSEESQRLPKEMAVKELLGAIVYLAAAVIVLEETP